MHTMLHTVLSFSSIRVPHYLFSPLGMLAERAICFALSFILKCLYVRCLSDYHQVW